MALGNIVSKRKVITAGPKDSLAHAAKLMEQNNIGAIVITDRSRPVGIVTDRDLALGVLVRSFGADDHIQTVMAYPVSTIRDDEDILDATRQMMELGVRRLPVVDKLERLVGMVTLDDLLLLLGRELHNMSEGVRAETSIR
jgi:CBS domain-containing protein